MLKWLNSLQNDYTDNLNTLIMNKECDRHMVEYLVDSIKGLEILPNIKILGYEWVPDEDKYDENDHVVRRNVNKKKMIKNIAETRCGVLYIDAEVSGFDKDGSHKIHIIKKPLIVPIQDKNGYYHLKGKKCYLIWQMVDKMHYPSIGAVTIKSLMPICVKTTKDYFKDIDDVEYTIPIYNIQIFKSAINVLMIYSNMCISKCLNFMEVYRFVKVLKKDEYKREEGVLYFECGKKSDIVVAVKKKPFDDFIYVKSVVGCLIRLVEDTKIAYENIDNWEEWMILVGGKNTIRRGLYQHIFLNRLLDDVTRKELKINDYDKQNIYYLLRWIIQNYHTLWAKDNLSMVNKRLRCNEYVGSLMTAEISKKINRLVALGDKATIRDFLSAFKWPENIFISKLYSSGVLRYSETNNCLDFGAKMTYTKKGPNSLGANDTKRIPIRQRLLHPSMLGFVDIASTSSSDPGQGGSLSPWNDMKSMYFDDSLAENELHFKIHQYLNELPKDDNLQELVIRCDDDTQHNQVLDSLFKYSLDKIRIFGTTTPNSDIIIELDPRDNYRRFNEDNLVEDEGAT